MKRINICALMFAVILQIAPSSAEAQTCAVLSTSKFTDRPPVITLLKVVSALQCTLTMSMNVTMCVPSVSDSTDLLYAHALNTATNPSCGWYCTRAGIGSCGTITIDNSDGLPVELMEFSVEE
jgi:hypothetical protein